MFNFYAIRLAIACTVIFLLQMLFPFVTENFALVSAEVFLKPWMLVSHIFLHGGIEHLMYNMFALVLFGLILEKIVGGKRFLEIFFAAGIIAGIGSALFYPSSLGASGAIFGIIGSLAILRPGMVVWTMGAPMPMIVAAFVWGLLDLMGMFAPGPVAHAAHLIGLGVGIIAGLTFRKQFKEFRSKRKIEDMPEEEFRKWEDKWMR